MQTLVNLYEVKHKNHTFFDRKLSILSKKSIITGPRKSGKTHLIIDYLSNFDEENILYIDFEDHRIDTKMIELNISKFVNSKPIKILVIENFNFAFKIPNVEEVILTCKEYKELEDFTTTTLFPLDFEEFIAFNTRNFNIENLFTLYTTLGSYPDTILNNQNNNPMHIQKTLKTIISDETQFLIFKKLSELSGNKISLFQIYNQLKLNVKISKDKLYEKVKKLEDTNMIFLVKKFDSIKANKKLFLVDFAIKNSLTFKKDFLKTFENMIFLELIKKSHTIFYTDFIDLFIPNERYAIFCIPFFTQELIQKKLSKYKNHFEELGIKKVDIVTIGNEGSFKIENIPCTILPFWDWALRD